MLIEWDGKTYDYEPGLIDMRCAMAIRNHTGMGMLSWERAVDDADPIALQALLWAVKYQAGERVPIKTLDFSVVDFYTAVKEAAMEAIKDRVAADVGTADEDPTQTGEPG